LVLEEGKGYEEIRKLHRCWEHALSPNLERRDSEGGELGEPWGSKKKRPNPGVECRVNVSGQLHPPSRCGAGKGVGGRKILRCVAKNGCAGGSRLGSDQGKEVYTLSEGDVKKNRHIPDL